MTTLLSRLYGNQSWGTKSKFNQRDAGREPSKTGYYGLLVKAMGYKREAELLKLLNECRMGTRVDRQGVLAEEFCTAGGGRLGRPLSLRNKSSLRDLEEGDMYTVMAASTVNTRCPRRLGNPVVIRKEYWQDACFLVGLEGDLSLLREIEKFLKTPCGLLGLGRRKYAPRTPLWMPPTGIRKKTLEKALEEEPWSLLGDEMFGKEAPKRARCVIEVPRMSRSFTRLVQDVPLDFTICRARGVRAVRDCYVNLD